MDHNAYLCCCSSPNPEHTATDGRIWRKLGETDCLRGLMGLGFLHLLYKRSIRLDSSHPSTDIAFLPGKVCLTSTYCNSVDAAPYFPRAHFLLLTLLHDIHVISSNFRVPAFLLTTTSFVSRRSEPDFLTNERGKMSMVQLRWKYLNLPFLQT